MNILKHYEKAAVDGEDYHVMSLGYSKCYDMVRSHDAGKAMQQWGTPAPFARMWGTAWSRQQRWLELAGASAANPLEGGNCLPQGDPAASIALAALLWAPARRVA